MSKYELVRELKSYLGHNTEAFVDRYVTPNFVLRIRVWYSLSSLDPQSGTPQHYEVTRTLSKLPQIDTKRVDTFKTRSERTNTQEFNKTNDSR
jgi:hypothetical protein